MSMKSVWLFWPNLIGYTRIVFAIASFACMHDHPSLAMVLYASSSLLDAFDGYLARLLNQGTRFGAVLDMVTDRSATTCLLIHLAQLYPAYTLAIQLLVALDLSSHYMQMVSTLVSGSTSHKAVSEESNPILRLYYTSRVVLFLVCAGNEMFLMTLFSLFHSSNVVLYGIVLMTLPVFVLKQGLNVVQLAGAASLLVKLDTKDIQDKRNK